MAPRSGEYRIPAGAGIGHVHLKVADLDRALAFYQDVLGFNLVLRLPDNSAAFLADIWQKESNGAECPNFEKLVKDSRNNLRDALTRLESELLAA